MSEVVLFMPKPDRWATYCRDGGYGDNVPRAVASDMGIIVLLVGIPTYWWKRTDLTPCVSPVELVVQGTVISAEPDPLIHASEMYYVAVPAEDLNGYLDCDDYVLDVPGEEVDEECDGEDCTECGGDGCILTPDSVRAEDLLDYLLDDYDASARSFSEMKEVPLDVVDDIYRDLRLMVQAISKEKPR